MGIGTGGGAIPGYGTDGGGGGNGKLPGGIGGRPVGGYGGAEDGGGGRCGGKLWYGARIGTP